MTHIESRPSKRCPGREYDFFVDCECSTEKKGDLKERLTTYAHSINVMARAPSKDEGKPLANETLTYSMLCLPTSPTLSHSLSLSLSAMVPEAYQRSGSVCQPDPQLWGGAGLRSSREQFGNLAICRAQYNVPHNVIIW